MLRLAGERLLQNLSAKLFSALPQDFTKGLVSFTEFCTQARFRVLYTINLKFFGC